MRFAHGWTIWDGEVTNTKKSDHKRVVTALRNISEGSELETSMDIDNLLRYMAVHVFSVNEDSLSGNPSPNWYARIAVCCVMPSTDAVGPRIGMMVAAWPEPETMKDRKSTRLNSSH